MLARRLHYANHGRRDAVEAVMTTDAARLRRKLDFPPLAIMVVLALLSDVLLTNYSGWRDRGLLDLRKSILLIPYLIERIALVESLVSICMKTNRGCAFEMRSRGGEKARKFLKRNL